MNPAPLLQLEDIRKSFGGVHALKGVSFDLRAGEIHALLGENGAGKSTLIKVLGGIHIPEIGQILIDGKPAVIRGVGDADECGVRIIHQELSLAPNLSVAENIYLGRESATFGILDRKTMFRQAGELVEQLGLNEIADVRADVSGLCVAHQQLVEIARALSSRARILVLDEPTSSLSDAETEALFETLDRLRSEGVGIIYISHRLEEIIRLADRITVLRDGESVGTQPRGDLGRDQLISWMVGRDISDHFHRPPASSGEVVLEVKGLHSGQVNDVSFDLRKGEVLGFAGLVGAGRSELAKTIFGLEPGVTGKILVEGRTVGIRGPRDALDAGIVLVPEDRKAEGLVMNHSVAFNAALPWVADWIKGIFPDLRKRSSIVDRMIGDFRVRVSDPELPVETLSGGNQQKVLVGRWMEHRPKVIILDEPTRGVDVGAREEIFTLIGRLVQEGMAVMLISSDLEEVLGISHRIAVYKDHSIHRIGNVNEFTAESIMRDLTGSVESMEQV
jgi:ABC-type sugar transport system ATPase subunit